MSIRLRNDICSDLTIRLTECTWRSTMDLADRHGWLPMGTIRPGMLAGLFYTASDDHPDERARLAAGIALGSYTPDTDRMVLLEDALNIADALEHAFLEREPGHINPERIIVLSDWESNVEDSRPGVGLLLALVDFFRQGAFWIERC